MDFGTNWYGSQMQIIVVQFANVPCQRIQSK